jgi:hypothetical protein
MTDAEIIKVVKLCCEYNPQCAICPLNEYDTCDQCMGILLKGCLDLINRQQAEIEELTHKLECLLCHATGSKLSKSTYSLRTMELAVNDEVQECCNEAKAEAIKEFAERLKERTRTTLEYCEVVLESDIDNLVKEMVGD